MGPEKSFEVRDKWLKTAYGNSYKIPIKEDKFQYDDIELGEESDNEDVMEGTRGPRIPYRGTEKTYFLKSKKNIF